MNETAANKAIYEDDHTTTIQSAQLTSGAEVAQAARSDMYALLADVFRYPDKEFIDFVRDGRLAAAFADLAAKLPFPYLLNDEQKKALHYPDQISSDDDMEAGFVRLFEAGPGDPPCPLVEGSHVKDTNRRSIFEDLIRFYNNFGLSYKEGSHDDRPDHISYELEFMHYLAFLTLRALQEEKDTGDFLTAQLDFLKHHLLKWTDLIDERFRTITEETRKALQEDDPVTLFYGNIISLLDRYIRADYKYIKETST